MKDHDPRGKALRDLLDFWHGGHLTVRSEAGGAWDAAVQAGEQALLTSDPHREHWVAISKAAEEIGASPNCDPEQAAEFCRAIDRLSAAIMGEDDALAVAPKSTREIELEELLRSACAIAERKGADTAWDRFASSVHALGINGITARTYRVLPSDQE